MKKSIIVLASLIFLVSCQSRVEEGRSGGMENTEAEIEAPRTAEPPPPPEPFSSAAPSPSTEETTQHEDAQEAPQPDTIGKKIIKDGQLRMEVEDLSVAKQNIDTLLKEFQAYYENEQYHATDYQSTYELKIRVLSQNFEALLNAIESGAGEVLSKNITARDVTEQYVDLSIRLANNRKYLERYNQLLARANSVEDILEIEERTRRIEEEIDSKVGQLKYLDDRVKYSTLTLTLIQYHEITKAERTSYGKKVVRAFSDGFDIFLNFLLVLVNLWPFLVLGVIIWIFRRRIALLFKRKKP
jgi:hypothetical protein